MGCSFCDADNISAHKLYETGTEYVICNIRPANKGHCLVVPKRHVTSIRELSQEETASLFKTVKFVSSVLNLHLKPVGFNYGFNEGSRAGQTMEHLHFHILPRFPNDTLPEFHLFHRDPKTKKNLSHKELKLQTTELRELFSK